MRAPFYELGALGADAALLVALGIGVVFGWFLERGGMGNARKLAAQFYLRDLTVFKLLFTAVITAMLGLFWLGRLGVLEPALVYVPPTYFVPHLLGGLVFGVGFVMGGLCPGTSCVAVSSGRLDGLVLLAGMLFGIFVFGEAFPVVEGLYESTPMGTVTLPELLGLPYAVVVAGITALALLAFRGADMLEARGPGVVGPGGGRGVVGDPADMGDTRDVGDVGEPGHRGPSGSAGPPGSRGSSAHSPTPVHAEGDRR